MSLVARYRRCENGGMCLVACPECRGHVADPWLDERVKELEAELNAKSKPIEPQFAKIVEENFWDLLADGDKDVGC